ncbi:MAG: hypothetical protein AAGI53_05445 [Planctomycetota bacterium]
MKMKTFYDNPAPHAGLALAIVLASGAAVASDPIASEWIEPVSGGWTDAANWSGGVPSDGDGIKFLAEISVEGVYTVDVDADILVTELLFSATGATVDAGHRSLEVAGSTTIGAGRLTGGSGSAFRFGTSGLGRLTSSNLVELQGTRVDHVDLVEIRGSALIEEATFTDVGRIEFGSSATLNNVTVSGNDHEMTLVTTSSDDSASFTDTGFSDTILRLNGNDSLNVTVASSIDDTCIDVGFGATVSANGLGGGLNFTGMSEINVTGGGTFNVQGQSSTNTGDNNQNISVAEGGTFRVLGGNTQQFVGLTFNNSGLVEAAEGATLATDGLNIVEGRLEGGDFAVRANSSIDIGEVEVFDLAAGVTLDGFNSNFDGLSVLETVSEGGRLSLEGSRDFATATNFDVANGARLEVGAGSAFEVGGALTSVVEGVLERGTFVIGGTVRATNLETINRVEGDLTVTGSGTLASDVGEDALQGLNSIGDTGSVSALDGRDIVVQSLTNEGTLRVGNGDGLGRTDGPGPGTEVRVMGDYVQAEGSTLVIQLGDGAFGALTVDGDFFFGSTDEPTVGGAFVLEIVGDVDFGDSFSVITASNFFGEFASTEAVDAATGETIDIDLVIENGSLVVTVVPAPPAFTAILGLAVLGRRRR